MHFTDADPSVVSGSNETYKGKITGQASVLLGLMVLGAVAFAFASLASWSVDDPSLSNANGKTAQNYMGYTGAVFSDLMMQFFGLASAALLVAPTVWGWMSLLQKMSGT